MPMELRFVGTVTGAGFDQAHGAVSIDSSPIGQNGEITVTLHSLGVTQVFDVEGPGTATLLRSETHISGDRVAIDFGAMPASVADILWDASVNNPDQPYSLHLSADGQQSSLATLVSTEVGGQHVMIAAADNGSGLRTFVLNGSGAPGAAQVWSDSAGAYSTNVSDLAVIGTSTATFVAASSASEDGLGLYRLSSNGALTSVTQIGRDESLPVQTITALESVEIAGQDFLIVASAGSSSLSVLSVGANGALGVADHVFDSLDTRFANVTQLTSVTIDGHVFVMAAGSDDGLSLFRLTAEGRLIHLDSLEDTVAMALSGVSGLGAREIADGFAILTTSANDAGLSHFAVDFAAPGDVAHRNSGNLTGTDGDDLLSLGSGNGTISGGNGDDVLSDGAGSDLLIGGAGADVFVMRRDNQRDVISGVRVGEDTLDLSQWGLLYSVDQLSLVQTSTGVIIQFAGEELELRSFDNSPLSRADVAALMPPTVGRIEVTLGDLQVAELPDDPIIETPPAPAPAPTPAPDTATNMFLEGTSINDFLEGDEGNDILLGREGNDTLIGNGGNDMLAASSGNDLVLGGDGNDNIGGGEGSDTIYGNNGNDTIGSGPGMDTIDGGNGNDVTSGGPGDDSVLGGAGDDTMAGSFANDIVKGEAGNDSLGGGPGTDTIHGGGGDDLIGAGEANDLVYGGPGDDFLAGGLADDRLFGDAGADTINGGTGDDTMTGGFGPDTFVFNTIDPGEYDVITDFQDGLDVLRLRGVDGAGYAGRFAALDIETTAQGVEISYGGHTIRLDGLSASQVDVGDFVFL